MKSYKFVSKFRMFQVQTPLLSEGPSNAQYMSRFNARVLIEVIGIWIERKLMCSHQGCPYFSILAGKCQDISTQEELSICGR